MDFLEQTAVRVEVALWQSHSSDLQQVSIPTQNLHELERRPAVVMIYIYAHREREQIRTYYINNVITKLLLTTGQSYSVLPQLDRYCPDHKENGQLLPANLLVGPYLLQYIKNNRLDECTSEWV